ncbi:unnamed protein product, partial [Linum tenue]
FQFCTFPSQNSFFSLPFLSLAVRNSNLPSFSFLDRLEFWVWFLHSEAGGSVGKEESSKANGGCLSTALTEEGLNEAQRRGPKVATESEMEFPLRGCW